MKPKDRRIIFIGSVILGGTLLISSLIKRSRKFEFKGKKVLITGGSRGLGLNLAKKLATQGAEIAIVARNHDVLENAKSDIEKHSKLPVHIYSCDLKDRNQVIAMSDYFVNKFGSVDVLINNAGIMQVGPENSTTIDDFDDAMNTHFWAPLLLTRAVIPGMKEKKSGRIINISSIGGKISVPHMIPYSASKFALTGLSEGFHAELKKDNIYVTTVCPGLMRTGSYRNAMVKGNNKNEFAVFSILANSPVTSISVDCAANKIINSSKYGCAEVSLSLQSRIATMLHGVSPSITSFLMSLINTILPSSNTGDKKSYKGFESESKWSKSALTLLGQLAAKRNNQFN